MSIQQCDLMLDPFPHGGGTAALEQIWMGVPIVTLHGNQAGGRTTASILGCMGRPGWVAHSQEEYSAKAVRWVVDPSCLVEAAEVRKTLRKELLDSPAVKGYVAAVEEAYRAMVKEKLCAMPTREVECAS